MILQKNNSTENYDKILFLWLNDKDFHATNSVRRGVRAMRVYKKCSLIMKSVRRMHIILRLPGVSVWFDNWKSNFEEYDTIIIHASKLTPPIVRYIRKKDKNIRIIVWYWNPVEKCVNPNRFANCSAEIWSFDEEDCIKYNLKYNTQYYFNDVNLNISEIKYDVFFIGGDKGRIKDLIEFQNEIKKMNISSYFHITPGASNFHTSLFTKKNEFADYYKLRISYYQVLEYISKSKAILDYVSERQIGLTLRPLEALFFRKKLITNDMSIIDRDFYNDKNVFVIGKDDIKELYVFLSSPFIEVEKKIRDKYDFKEWIERFYEGVEERI